MPTETLKYDFHILNNMEFEVTKVGERGQVVIPQSVRKEMKIHKGDKFMVIQRGNVLVLRRLHKPTMKEFKKMLKECHDHAKKHGLTPKDMEDAIRKVRGR